MTPSKHDLRFIVVLPVELGRAFGLGHLSRRVDRSRPIFAPRVTTLDDIHELRICELTGRQAVISSRVLQSFPDQAGGQAAVGPEFHYVDRLSSVCVPDAPTPIGMAFANEQKDTAAGVKND